MGYSSTTFTQSLSDWFTPKGFAGGSVAVTMLYRDNGAGQRDNRTFYLYEYAFALNAARTVASISLPNNRSVVALAATLERDDSGCPTAGFKAIRLLASAHTCFRWITDGPERIARWKKDEREDFFRVAAEGEIRDSPGAHEYTIRDRALHEGPCKEGALVEIKSKPTASDYGDRPFLSGGSRHRLRSAALAGLLRCWTKRSHQANP